MIEHRGRGVLLDMEGTISSIEFVHRTLFGYAREQVVDFLPRRWADERVLAACEQIASEAGEGSLAEWGQRLAARGLVGSTWLRAALIETVQRWIAEDRKLTGLKRLQGLIWEEGYAAGTLRSHLYPDVAPALRRWHDAGLRVSIYSSGSAQAQRVFMQHTVEGDLSALIAEHYDTTVGGKREVASYREVALREGLPADEILFLSDTPEELDAARAAGMGVGLVCRGAAAQPSPFMPVRTLDQIHIVASAHA